MSLSHRGAEHSPREPSGPSSAAHKMPSSVLHHDDLLRRFGLSRNPYVDRTAEQSGLLDDVSLFIPSDLRNFRPSPATFLFFGKRGSGKTTIRMMMQKAYEDYNYRARYKGTSRGFFVADMTKPSHLTTRLRAWQKNMAVSMESWDSSFAESWSLADFVDSVISVVMSSIASRMGSNAPHNVEGQDMVDRAKKDPAIARQVLLLSHLYADGDAETLASLRAKLLPKSFLSNPIMATGTAAVVALGAIGGMALSRPILPERTHPYESYSSASSSSTSSASVMTRHPGLVAALAISGISGVSWACARVRRQRSIERAAAVQSHVRIVSHRPVELVASVIDATFSMGDTPETIRAVAVGISAHQKLEKLATLLQALGYDDLVVFGDGFDEVSLLDPVTCPSALKAFAREACRSDLLNKGRIHLFFPDTRLALDLNTDKVLKEARFDRHFVRDLTWSRHQLEALAERRFLAAQLDDRPCVENEIESDATDEGGAETSNDAASGRLRRRGEQSKEPHIHESLSYKPRFSDLFAGVSSDDLSSYSSKLSTPRELLIMMNESFARLEAHPEQALTGHDLEIATQKALEQAV